PSGADCFYFFNPFSAETLRSVLARITGSWYESPRPMRLLFYYPSDEYRQILMDADELTYVREIDCSDLFPGDERERVLCFETGRGGE
ncbi:MAG: SAM-dependent methyltransferase, partial [Clostridia bacterium]|nr:SAM-dependent methyltransferase [Clostridia bacterium]